MLSIIIVLRTCELLFSDEEIGAFPKPLRYSHDPIPRHPGDWLQAPLKYIMYRLNKTNTRCGRAKKLIETYYILLPSQQPSQSPRRSHAWTSTYNGNFRPSLRALNKRPLGHLLVPSYDIPDRKDQLELELPNGRKQETSHLAGAGAVSAFPMRRCEGDKVDGERTLWTRTDNRCMHEDCLGRSRGYPTRQGPRKWLLGGPG